MPALSVSTTTRPGISWALSTAMASCSAGVEDDLNWVAAELSEVVVLKIVGKVGGDMGGRGPQ